MMPPKADAAILTTSASLYPLLLDTLTFMA
jgi:hypothetical protein